MVTSLLMGHIKLSGAREISTMDSGWSQAGTGGTVIEADTAYCRRRHWRLLKVAPSLEQTLCAGSQRWQWRMLKVVLVAGQMPMLSKVGLGAVEGIAVTGADAACY